MSDSSHWKNLRVKEEPLSDYEDSRRRSSSSSTYHRRERSDYEDRGREGGRRNYKRERHSPSPPPSHGRHRASGQPPRSRSRSPDSSREREISSNRSRWERDSSRERAPHRERDRKMSPNREREHERPRGGEVRVKQERRSASPRFRSPPPPRQDRRRNNGGDQGPSGSRDRPRGNARERDWDNFFNPKSEMSQTAFVKREKDERERKTELGEFGKKDDDSEAPKEKEQPNFGLSGKLTEESNTFRGVVIKYAEPPEARKPNKIRWRLYPFKGEEALPVMYVHRQSAYLLGRDRKVVDIPVDHPSCSKQHAVLQYRLVPYQRPDGSKGRRIRPYIIDLESANGTFVNGKQIDAKRYVELIEKDVLKFGFSSREYVLLHDESKNIEDDSPESTPERN